ncbi:MAG: arsenite efflux MFS transporter ArsK [Rhizobiaceae bacterium]
MSILKFPAAAIWALGATQIIGYGTLYYSYSILAPGVSAELRWSQEWVFGVLSVALLASAFLAPIAGIWADRFGAGRLMLFGSLAAAAALLFCAFAPGRVGFAIGVVAMELASCFILYSTAFVAIVQLGGPSSQRRITHLTLVAGFASTLFWPLTTYLNEYLSWREVLMVFAAMHLMVCLPIHVWIAKLTKRTTVSQGFDPLEAASGAALPEAFGNRSLLFGLMLAGFAVEGLVLSAILVHMVPLTAAIGLGAAGVFVASLFGPSQVASRLINMLFGQGLSQTWLAFGATTSLATGLVVLLMTAPSLPGAVAFAILFGLGSGLMSIVGGTLPLELFGRAGYGAFVGWITAARQLSAALAPFGFTLLLGRLGVFPALWVVVGMGLLGIVAFAAIQLVKVRFARLLQLEPVEFAG